MKNYCKLLIVDDELIMRQGIAHMTDWNKEGFEIIGQASNGQEAIDIIKANTPHIVITDVVMPKIDGIELAKYIQENYPSIKILVLSSYSDFDYVKSSFKSGAIDYILKPSLNLQQLIETLKKSAGDLISGNNSENEDECESMINRIICNTHSASDLEKLITKFKHNDFCLFGLNLKSMNYNYKSQNNFNSSLDEIFNIFPDSEYVIKKVLLKQDIMLFIINFESRNYNNLKQSIKDFCNKISLQFPESFFALSRHFSHLVDANEVFENEFLKLCDEKFYNKGLNLLISDQFVQHENSEKFDFKAFTQLTSKMEINESLKMLTRYVHEVIRKQVLNEIELKSFIQNCFYHIISTFESLDDNFTKIQKLKYRSFNLIQESKYSQDLLENYDTLMEDFNEMISEYQHRINSNMINKIIIYINEHYDENLNLSEMASLFNFNYYYLSSYFSSHTKEGFNEFLNKIRIEKACEFLKKDIPISQISSMVGYSDHSYFCKVFKKFTGVTPSVFRKNSIKVMS